MVNTAFNVTGKVHYEENLCWNTAVRLDLLDNSKSESKYNGIIESVGFDFVVSIFVFLVGSV